MNCEVTVKVAIPNHSPGWRETKLELTVLANNKTWEPQPWLDPGLTIRKLETWGYFHRAPPTGTPTIVLPLKLRGFINKEGSLSIILCHEFILGFFFQLEFCKECKEPFTRGHSCDQNQSNQTIAARLSVSIPSPRYNLKTVSVIPLWCLLFNAGLDLKLWKNSKFYFSQKSNLKVSKFYFEKYCYCNFKAGFLKTSYFCPIEKISRDEFIQFNWAKILRICCSEYVLWDKHRTFPCSAFCRSYVLKRMLDYLEQIKLVIISCVLNFSKIFMLITASYLFSFIECKYYSFSSVLLGVIFSQVNPGIPQQVADLILRCQISIQL